MNDAATSGISLKCNQCGAHLPLNFVRCWMCGSRDPRGSVDLSDRLCPYETGQDYSKLSWGNYMLSCLLLFGTLSAVVTGVCSFAPGIGIPVGLFVFLPVFLAYFFKDEESDSGNTSRIRKAAKALISFVVVFVASQLLLVAALVALLVVCSGFEILSGP